MSTRKEKADNARKKRQERTVVNPTLTEAVQKDITDKGSVSAFTAPVAAIKTDEELAKSREISKLGGVNAEKLGYKVEDGVLKNPLEIQNKGLEQHASKGLAQPQAQTIKVPQVQPTVEEEKAPTLLDLTAKRLAELKEKAETEKTDAAKMQKYYALADAFSALGKMGGAAIGGAIGGNMMDSAPIVEDYKPSRGYLDAIEKSKNANERLRALDEKEFNLAVRDEERSYKQQIDKLNRDYQKWLTDYKYRLDRAKAEDNLAMQEELLEEKSRIEQEMQEKILGLKNKYQVADRANSRANMEYQYDKYGTVPVAFTDGTGMKMSESEYAGLLRFVKAGSRGKVTDANIDEFIATNPQLVRDYMAMINGETVSKAANSGKPTDTGISTLPSIQLVQAPTGNQATDAEAEDAFVFDPNKIADAEEEALRRDVGVHGIPFMKSGNSGYIGQTKIGTASTNNPAPKTADKKTGDKKKDNKSGKIDLNQFKR